MALDQLIDADTDAPIAPGVHLLNAHVGKGQQFDWVFVLGFEKGHPPNFLAGTAVEPLEEQRILLIMLSRARHGVVVSRAQTLVSKAGNTYSTDRGPWTWLVAGSITEVKIDGLHEHLSRLAAAPDHDLDDWRPLARGLATLRLDRCARCLARPSYTRIG